MLKGAFYFFLKASSMLGFSFSFFFLIAGWGTSRSVGICGRLCRAGTVPGVRMAIRAAAAGRPCRTDGSASRACGWRCRAGTVLGWVCADDYVLREGGRAGLRPAGADGHAVREGVGDGFASGGWAAGRFSTVPEVDMISATFRPRGKGLKTRIHLCFWVLRLILFYGDGNLFII